MSESIITINGENIATILLVMAIGLAVLRIFSVWYGKKSG